MKKTIISFIATWSIIVTGLKAQTIQEGMNHLYAARIKTAAGVFDKLLAVNPNHIEAIYWRGQAYLQSDLIMSSRLSAARQLYEKALQTTNGAPLIQVGMGHIELLENKTDEAKVHFETALSLTRTKKGDDPGIEIAIGRAIADSKTGDYQYGIRLLEDATTKEPKNADAWLILGNLYRKATPGEGGSQAFMAFKKALEVNPGFAIASLRLAKWAESIKDNEQILDYLNESVKRDPNFTASYYELFYYYFFKLKYPEAEEQLNKYIASKLPESDIQDQFLYAQLCWAKKDYDCAVTKAESVASALGNDTKPKVYRLLADANFNKGDFYNAKKYSDLFFQKKNPDDYITFDHELRARILSKTGGTPDEIFDNYMKGAQLDTVYSSKIDFLKQAADYFNQNKLKEKQALVLEKIIELRTRPIINDYFDLMKANYDIDNYPKSREVALTMRNKFTDQVFGYDWAFKNSTRIDTVQRDSIAVPDAQLLYEFSQRDTIKFRNQYFNSVRFLAGYYFNAKEKEKALVYLQKWRDMDTAKAADIQGYIDQIKKMPSGPPASNTPGAANKQPPSPAAKPRN